jgi:hypothetical protein
MDRYAVLPVANLIAQGCTLQLARDFDEKLFVEFEEFVSADKDFVLLQEEKDLLGKVRTVNQVREDRGLDHVEWGDDPVAKVGEVPYDPDDMGGFETDMPSAFGDPEPEEPEDPEEEEEPEDEAERVAGARSTTSRGKKTQHGRSSKTRLPYFHPDAEWKRQMHREKKFVPTMLRVMRSIFRDQHKSVMQKLAEQQDAPRALPLDPAWSINPELLIDPDEWERMFAVRAEPLRQAAFLEIVRETITGLGGEAEAFVFTDEIQKKLAEQGALLVKQVNATTGKRLAEAVYQGQADAIAGAIGEGVAAGEAPLSIAHRIEKVFKVRNKEARTIARTEVLKATQMAQLEAFAEMDVERKQWNCSFRNSRDPHKAASGDVVERGQPFYLDGEPAAAPGIGFGGGQLSAANSINCQCFLTPVFD